MFEIECWSYNVRQYLFLWVSYFKEFMKTWVFFSNHSHIHCRVSCGKSVTASAEVAANGEALPAAEETPLTNNAPVKQGPVFNKKHKDYYLHISFIWRRFISFCCFTAFNNFVSLFAHSEKTFRECLLSRFFLWHLLWLSVMQLRHYLFIGTLNPMLQRLTGGQPSLGKHLTVRLDCDTYRSCVFQISSALVHTVLLSIGLRCIQMHFQIQI